MAIKSYQHILKLGASALMLVALTACGGGGGGGGGTAGGPDEGPGVSKKVYPTPDKLVHNPSDDAPSGLGADWTAALASIRSEKEYAVTGAYSDQIGVAYAHARGATGNNIVISNMGRIVDSGLRDIGGIDGELQKAENGYVADTKASTGFSAACTGACDDVADTDSHILGIMIGASGNSGTDTADGVIFPIGQVEGVAYDATYKNIDIFTGDVYDYDATAAQTAIDGTDTDDPDRVKLENLNLAIGEASGASINVMNNGWSRSADGVYDHDSAPATADRHYETVGASTNIHATEITAWTTAVGAAATGTIVVFAQGDQGHNSETGMVQLYEEAARTTKAGMARWSDVNEDVAKANIGSSHARLGLATGLTGGRWLSVVALDHTDTIASFSNGCGDAMAYCLAAPGVDILSLGRAKNSDGEEFDEEEIVRKSGTAQAAAYVSAAVAVVESSFGGVNVPMPHQIVNILLNTAIDLGATGTDAVYGHGKLNLAAATDPMGKTMTADAMGASVGEGITLDSSGIALPTSFGASLNGFTVGFIDDYKRAYVGRPTRVTQQNAAFTLSDTFATWESPELQNIKLDSNSKMQFTNDANAKDKLIFTHNNANHTVAFSYNEESKTPDLRLAGKGDDLHFQKIRPIAKDLMQVNSTHKLGGKFSVKNSITTGEFDTGNRFNEAMANLNYTGKNSNLTIGAGNLQEYGQFLGASGTGAYQLSDATQSKVTHLAVTQNLPKGSAIKVKYTNFKTEVDMRYNNFAKIDALNANEYQVSFAKQQVLGKNDSIDFELIQPFAVTDGKLQQSTILGYKAEGGYNNVVQNYDLTPEKRRQQVRMTWQNQVNRNNETKLFISMQYENHVDNLKDKEQSTILGGISTKF